MAKKGQNKGKKGNPSVKVSGSRARTAQGRTYNQINPDQKKRRQKNKRIEFVLNPAYDEDRKMIALLEDLQGGKSDYIREAIALKMEHDQHPLHDMMEDMIRAIAILGSMLQAIPTTPYFDAGFNGVRDDIRGIHMRAVQAFEISGGMPQHPPTLPEQDTSVVRSSGLDLSSPRPRPKLQRGPVVAQDVTEELSEAESIRLAKIMAESVKRANPGGGTR